MSQYSITEIDTQAEKSPDFAETEPAEAHAPLRGIKVLVITSGHEATDVRIYAKQACSLQAMGAEIKVVGKLERGRPGAVPVVVVPAARSRLCRFLLQPWQCLWRARKERADVIHFHDAEMLGTIFAAKLWWRGSKFVYDVHEDFANLMLVRDWLPRWAKPIVRALTDRIEKWLASQADAIIGVTPPLAAKFSNRARIVAYNYVAGEFFARALNASRKPNDREFDLVHVGYLSSKRAAFLADVICHYQQQRPSGRALVIGLSGEMLEYMRGRVPANCVLMGKRSNEEVASLLGNSRIGLDVHPWLNPHLEVALPVKVCEYMASGCAVVASGMPVLNNLLAGAGAGPDIIAVLEGGEPADYAAAAVKLVEDIDSGLDPGAELRTIASKTMRWDSEAEKIGKLYLALKNA